MFIVRETFTAKPGQASALASKFKQVFASLPEVKTRVLTDFVAGFNTVVLETEVPNLEQFAKSMQDYQSRDDIRAKMKGYTEMYVEGRREIYQVM
jgi:hypothetical protein